MNFKIELNNVIAIDLTKDWGNIANELKINGKFLFQLKLDGYDIVWIESYHGSHRLIGYKKGKTYHVAGKFLNNISNDTVTKLFKIGVIKVDDKKVNTNNKPVSDSVRIVERKKVSKKESVSSPILKKKVSRKVEKKTVEFLSVDNILDKITKNGIESLTIKEKKFLDEASKNL